MEFRVSVCLKHYFNDERSYCYVYLDKKYDTIAAFGRYLRHQFRLRNKFCLMTNNNLLPDDQTTKIIQPGDIITVIPLKENWWQDEESEVTLEIENGSKETTDVLDGVGFEKVSKKKKKKKSKSEVTEPPYINEHISLKKEELGCPKSTENESSKKKDTCMDVSMISEGDHDIEQDVVADIEQEDLTPNENLQESDPHIQGPQKIAHMESAIQQLKIKALTLLNEVATQKAVAGVSGGRINKRKRIRKRNKNSSLSVSTPDLSDSSAAAPITFKPVLKSASHIRFESEQPANFNVHNTVRNSEITTKPRIIHAIEPISTSNSRRTSICGFPFEMLNVTGYLADITAVNGNVTTNDIGRVNKEPSINIESIKKRLSEFPVMDDVYPVVKDLIMFKMLKMGSDYTPSFSDFILADVLEVDKPNGVIKVSIREGQKECIPITGKFDLEPLSSEEETITDKLIIDIAWGQVTEPRLILPNLRNLLAL